MIRKTILILFLLVLSIPGFSQNIVMWTGGIGIEERESAPTTGTKLVFFSESGDFLSNVLVTIKNEDGAELVKTTTSGPWLILNLQPGQYSIRAEMEGRDAQGGIINVDSDTGEFGFMFH